MTGRALRRGWAGGQRWLGLRLIAVTVILAALFVALGHRAYVLQVREAARLKQMAEEQYSTEIELPARRGRILDRFGGELAASVNVDSVYANPRLIAATPGGAAAVAKALSGPLRLDEKRIEEGLAGKRYFAWIKRRVLPEEARAVRELGLRGVGLTQEPSRYYPNRVLGEPMLGWAGVDGRGLEGLELSFDHELRGSRTKVSALRDALGRELLPTSLGDDADTAGSDVETTIDPFIQGRLERALADGVARTSAKAGTAVAIDPWSGDVLAMAAVPTLNPNQRAAGQGVRNRAITDPYEPGSTMKTFVIASAMAAGLVGPDDPWFCENGRWAIGKTVIHDAERIGNVTTTGVLAESSNICTAKIAQRSGKQRVYDMLRAFGFGQLSGVELPGERAGTLRPAKRWGDVEMATIAFGQGMTATPLQIALGYAAIANGGTLYQPRVVRRVLDGEGHAVRENLATGRRVLSEKVAGTMKRMLHAVMLPGGTASKLAIPGYPGGGKTGTAQKVDPATRRYSHDKWSASFVGFAPLEHPRVVMLVLVDEPVGVHYGGAVAGPIWREAMGDVLRYLSVPPEAPDELRKAVARAQQPAAVPSTSADAEKGMDPDDPDPMAGEDQVEATTVEEEGALATDGVVVPDFRGLSVGEALDAARRAMLSVEIHGSGYAIAQQPAPGTAGRGVRVRVEFAPPG